MPLSNCGKLKRGSNSDPRFVVQNDLSPRYLDPDFSPFITPGSREVLVSPDPEMISGPTIMRLYAEKGAKIFFDLQEFSKPEMAREYKDPVLLIPPFTIWTVAQVDGKLGKVQKFAYPLNSKQLGLDYASEDYRLQEINPQIISSSPKNINATLLADTSPIKGKFELDGNCQEWTENSPYLTLDPLGDLPPFLAHVDIKRAAAFSEGDYYYLMIETGATPRRRERIAFGFSAGPSRIDLNSFGKGVNYDYQLEMQNGRFELYKKGSAEGTKFSDKTEAALERCFEAKVLKSDLAGTDRALNVAFRPYAVDWSKGFTIRDRMLPIYLASSFESLRFEFNNAGTKNFVDFFVEDSLAKDSFVQTHLYFSQQFLSAITKLNGLPVYELSSFPFYYTKVEESGYAGLNATDRGLLSTWGKNKPYTGIAQLVAHEFAHFQNAGFSRVDEQWMQEGMSEWAAERAMYKVLPARAVYRNFVKRRIEPFLFNLGNTAKSDNYLEKWEKDLLPGGYERSYAFFVLLDSVVGSKAIAKAFRYGYGMGLDGKGFKTFLERETGRSLDNIFRFYVNAGEVHPDFDPSLLFSDDDDDGLLNIDEKKLGTSPDNTDTDNDGFYDGEELFSGMDPKLSLLKDEIAAEGNTYAALTSDNKNVPSAYWRAGTGIGEKIFYSGFPHDGEKTEYKGPVSAYPPFSLYGDIETVIPYLKPLQNGQYGELAIPQLPNVTSVTSPGSGRNENLAVPYTSGSMSPEPDKKHLWARDYAYDLPPQFGAYDIAQFTAYLDSEQNLILRLRTRDDPDIAGAWGPYSFSLKNLCTVQDCLKFTSSEWGKFEVVRGEPLFNGSEIEQASVKFGSSLDIKIAHDRISTWLESSRDQVVCATTEVELTSSKKLVDEISCIPVKTSARRFAAEFKDSFAELTHTVELYVSGDNADAESYLKLFVRNIHSLSSVLQRPIAHRNHWPVYLFFSAADTGAVVNPATGHYFNLGEADLDATIKAWLVKVLVEGILYQRLGDQGVSTTRSSDRYTYFYEWVATRSLLLSEKVENDLFNVTRQTYLDTLERCNESSKIASVFSMYYNFFPLTNSQYDDLLTHFGITESCDTN